MKRWNNASEMYIMMTAVEYMYAMGDKSYLRTYWYDNNLRLILRLTSQRQVAKVLF